MRSRKEVDASYFVHAYTRTQNFSKMIGGDGTEPGGYPPFPPLYDTLGLVQKMKAPRVLMPR